MEATGNRRLDFRLQATLSAFSKLLHHLYASNANKIRHFYSEAQQAGEEVLLGLAHLIHRSGVGMKAA